MQSRSKKRAALIGAAVMPAVAMLAQRAVATPVVTVTNLGTTHTATFTATGYTSFLVSVTADSGQVITSLDIGSPSNPTNGIFGQLLQRWTAGTYDPDTGSAFFDAPSPTSSVQTQGIAGQSADTHIVLPTGQSTVTFAAPAEDSNVTTNDSLPNVNHPAGAPPDNAVSRYGTGTFLKGAIGYFSPQNNTQPLAYVVLKDGTFLSGRLTGSEALPGFAGIPFGPVTFGAIVEHEGRIISLTAASAGEPITYGNKLTDGAGIDRAAFSPNAPVANSINVTGFNGTYQPGFANNINNGAGENLFHVLVSGFSPTTDPEIYALNVKVAGTDPTAAQVAAIINDINASTTGASASTVTGQFATLFPGYDVLLTATAGSSAPAYLGINFANDLTTPAVTVTDIAAIPEPTGVGLLLLGASGLRLGRRKRGYTV